MASGTPTDDSPGRAGATQDGEAPLGNALTPNLDDAQWRQANQLLERRYLELGRAQIDEMCLDLKARLSASMSAGLQQRLRAETQVPGIDFTHPDAQRQVEEAAAMAGRLLGDITWVLPWEQARSLVEPYAKGSWLLAQIQANEEQRVITVFAAELMRQASDYMRDLIFRYYGLEASQQPDGLSLPVPIGAGEQPVD
ncbi:MAG TPA: hypothetical protein VM659_23185 [Dongiaceae bacterium]|nr:hypothetical protein [Dongiaceae bacterium]